MRAIRLSSSFPPLPPQPPRPPSPAPPEGSPLDKDVIIVLGAVLCVLICAVWVHSIVRCMLRRNRQAALMAAATAAAVQAAEQMDASFVGLDPKIIAALPVISAPNPGASAEPGIPPASEPELAAIISNTECIICLQEFAQSEPIKLLPNCGHGFHVECIGAWLRSHSSCPICRHAVLEPPSPLGGASSSRGSVDVSSSSMLLASPLMQHYQQQLYYQQNQQFRQQQPYFQQQIGSASSSLYTMFAADGGRAGSNLRVLHLSENPAAATTAAATAARPH